MKRKKANFWDLVENNVDYIDYMRIKRFGRWGWLYKLDNPLSNVQHMYLSQFNNVSFVMTQSQYAPEQIHKCIILFDKMLPAEANL